MSLLVTGTKLGSINKTWEWIQWVSSSSKRNKFKIKLLLEWQRINLKTKKRKWSSKILWKTCQRLKGRKERQKNRPRMIKSWFHLIKPTPSKSILIYLTIKFFYWVVLSHLMSRRRHLGKFSFNLILKLKEGTRHWMHNRIKPSIIHFRTHVLHQR